ncbi:MAG TPA: GntR family transcriptional regulator, partial [Fimbriiglobus sp.]|nr:GntR family transcriptional regulator [Fimbriiglobus sp.]
MQETLAEKTYQHLRRKVLTGELQAGSQLVNRTLAEELEVSLAPVREAIHRLATEGLVDHIPGAGAFVRKLNSQDLEELYVLREAVESCAAAEAARYIADWQLDVLDEVCRRFAEIVEEVRRRPGRTATAALLDRWLDCEERFHSIVVEAARNRLLAKVVHEYRALVQVFGVQRHRETILTEAVAEETARGHEAIAGALRHRDADTARRLMSAHIQRGRQTVLE